MTAQAEQTAAASSAAGEMPLPGLPDVPADRRAPQDPAPQDQAPQGGRRRLVLRGGLWNAASQLLPSFGVALLSIVAARVLGADALGRQSLIAYVNGAAAGVVVTGLSYSSMRQMGALRGKGELDTAERLGAWVVQAHIAAGTLVGVAVAVTGLLLHQDRLAWLIIGLVTIVDAAVSGIGVRVAVRQGWVELGRMQLVAQLIGAPLGVLAVLVGLGIPGIFAGDGIAAIGLLVVCVARFGATFPRQRGVRLWHPPVPVMRSWALFGLNGLIYQVVGRRVEFIALALLSTDRQIGFYSVAFMLVSLLAAIPSAVAAAALPMLAASTTSEADIARTQHHAHLAVRVGTVLSVPLTAMAAGLGPSVVKLVYGQRYAEASGLVPLAATVLLVAVAAGICNQYWLGRGQLRPVLTIGVVAGIMDLGTAFGLVSWLGATGAVIANLVGQAVAAAALIVFTARRTGAFGWRVRNLAAMFWCSAVGGGIAFGMATAVHRALVGPPAPVVTAIGLVAGALVGGVALLSFAVLLDVFDEDEAGWLRPLLPGVAAPLLQMLTRPAAAGPGHG